MRLAVRTGDLRSAAQALADAADRVDALAAGLRTQRSGIGSWTTSRARTQVDAFLGTLLDGVATTAQGLDDLALRTSVAAQGYEDAETAALPRPR